MERSPHPCRIKAVDGYWHRDPNHSSTEKIGAENWSDWIDWKTVTTCLVDRMVNTKDPNTIKEAPLFKNRGFSLRMLVLPVGQGNTQVWLVCGACIVKKKHLKKLYQTEEHCRA